MFFESFGECGEALIADAGLFECNGGLHDVVVAAAIYSLGPTYNIDQFVGMWFGNIAAGLLINDESESRDFTQLCLAI